jgi:uncharacterized protein
MTLALWLSVVAASVMGSVHCAAMCGGVVAFAGASLNRKRRLPGHVCYHTGRLMAYLTLGAAAGAFGLGVDSAAARGGIGGGAALFAGSLMLLWALSKLLPRSLGASKLFAWLPQRLGCGYTRAFSRLTNLPPLLRASTLGVATGLLPCGWLYAFVVAAAATGSLTAGSGILFAFWLGTLPALIGVGSLTQLLSERMRKLLPTLSAGVLLIVGVGNLWTRYESGKQALTWHAVAPAELVSSGATHSNAAPRVAPVAADPSPTDPEADLPPCHRH